MALEAQQCPRQRAAPTAVVAVGEVVVAVVVANPGGWAIQSAKRGFGSFQ